MRTRSHSLDLIRRAFASVLALAAAIFLIGFFGSSNAAAAGGNDKVTIIVKMAPGLSENEHASTVARNGGSEKARVNRLSLKIIEVPANAADAILKKYQDDPNVTRAEKSKQRQTDRAPVDPLFGSQWALPRIGWDQVFGNMTPTGTATVAVLDTGINAAHPDLAGNVVAGTSFIDGSSGMTDPNGHGTWVAGIVAARADNGEGIAGVGFAGVRVMPVTVLNSDGLGDDADVVQGVVWAADNGANVILMAFSNPGFSESLQEAIDYAWARGVVLVAAAGNDGWSTPSFPAGDRGVIGVAATDENDLPALFSNEGQSVFMAAPGTNIQTTDNEGYRSVSGTSSSAAYVAGAAALLKAFDPAASNGIIVGRLARNADPAGSAGDTGNGRLNLARALGDTSTESVQPAGADPVGQGGPFVGPYVAAAVKTVLTIAADFPTIVYGMSVTFTATIKCDAAGGTCAAKGDPITSGTLTIGEGNSCGNLTQTFASGTPNANGQISFTTTELTGGTHTIRACYQGSGSGNDKLADNDASMTETVNVQNSFISNISGMTPATVVGENYLVTVSVSKSAGAGVNPTGTVQVIYQGGSCTATLVGSTGTGSCSLPSHAVGTFSVTLNYSGDSNYRPATTSTQHVINQASTTTTITNAGAPTLVGQSYTVSFTVVANAPSTGAPTPVVGTVNVSDGTGGTCSAVVVSTTAQCSLTSTTAGIKTITATYVGSIPYAGSVSPGVPHTVSLRSTSTSVLCPTPVFDGVANTCTITVADGNSGAVTPTGVVSVTASGAGVSPTTPSCTLSGNGNSATCTVSLTGTIDGTVSVSASYPGDSAHSGSGGSTTFAVIKRWTITATAGANGTIAPSGAVLVNQGSNQTFTITPNVNFVVDGIVVDGSPAGTATSYAFNNVQANHTIHVTFKPANVAPIAQAVGTVTTNEDTAVDITLTVIDGDGDALQFGYMSPAPGTGLVSDVSPTSCSGNPSTCTLVVRYTPPANYNGSTQFSFWAVDPSNAQSNVVIVRITVAAVNDRPTFNEIPIQVVMEDSGLKNVAINGVTPGPANEGSQTVVVTATSSNPAIVPHPTVSGTGASRNLAFTPLPNANGDVIITVTADDQESSNNTFSRQFVVRVLPVNDAPEAAGGSATTQEDNAITFSISASDIDSGLLTFQIVTGIPASAGTLALVGSPTCTPADTVPSTTGSNCTHQVTYTPAPNFNTTDDFTLSFTFSVNDGTATSNVATVNIEVTPVNDPPAHLTMNLSAATIEEGDSVTVSGTFSDPDKLDSHTVTISWGDSTTSQASVTGNALTGYSYTATRVFADDNPTATASDIYVIGVTVVDGGGLQASASKNVTVENVEPELTSLTLVSTGFTTLNPMPKTSNGVTLTVAFADPGLQDTFTCSINWDDGAGPQPGTLAVTGTGAYTCSGIRSFGAAGVYSPVVTITDDDTGVLTVATPFVVIYDPAGGFVTGGGWINSPARAYKLNEALTGKANFGFVSKYQKGASVPVGETEFQFHVANFKFKSTSYEWLVVAGSKAQYKGVGTVNGAGSYGFLLTAWDGQGNGNNATEPDRFRIKIWEIGGGVVYDNNVNGASDDIDTADPQAIAGGSIVVHK